METEVTEETPKSTRPSTLSITDDALDMSANNTLSFVFTQPPKLFTVNVRLDLIDILHGLKYCAVQIKMIK